MNIRELKRKRIRVIREDASQERRGEYDLDLVEKKREKKGMSISIEIE